MGKVMDQRKAEFIEQRSEVVLPSGCHIWMKQIDKDGYALANFKSGGAYKTFRVSRIVCEARNGPSFGRMSCHTCDTPSCVNPDHLFWGDAAKNNQDRSSKGRTSRHRAKLNQHQVDEIRLRYAATARTGRNAAKLLAADFGVHPNTIRNVVSGAAWGPK